MTTVATSPSTNAQAKQPAEPKAEPTNEEMAAAYAAHIFALRSFETVLLDGKQAEYEYRVKLTGCTKREIEDVLKRYPLSDHTVMGGKFGALHDVLLLIRPKKPSTIAFQTLTKYLKEPPVKTW